MRQRIDTFGVAEPEIQRAGSDQIDVSLPGSKNADDAARQVGKTAQLYFYDWETNVLDANCKPDPTNTSVTGGPSAGRVGGLSHYDAVVRASKCPATNTGKETTNGLYFYVDDKTQKVLAGPFEAKSDLQKEIVDKKLPETKDQRIVEVKPGTVVLQAEKGTDGKPSDQFYVLRDAPALNGTDIKNPKQNFDNGPGGSGGPTVTFDFTDKGRKSWQKTTRAIAQRGQDNFFGGSPQDAFQHFAIALDNELISTPYIDFQQNPDGIDGANGSEISGGFTIKTAQNLATLLKTGALPIKLQLISASSVSATLGKQALNEGLIAGLVGPRPRLAVPAAHLPRARPGRDLRARGLRHVHVRARQADPDHDDAAGHRRPDPHDRRRRGREHHHLRTRQGGDTRRKIGADRHLAGLQEGPDRDRRRERRHVHGRVHPVHPGDRRGEGLRVHARRRHPGLVPHRGPPDAGRAGLARAARG